MSLLVIKERYMIIKIKKSILNMWCKILDKNIFSKRDQECSIVNIHLSDKDYANLKNIAESSNQSLSSLVEDYIQTGMTLHKYCDKNSELFITNSHPMDCEEKVTINILAIELLPSLS